MTLTYDMTFAIILLSSLYEAKNRMNQHRCKVHPVKKQAMIENEITQYAADMNVLLAYYHMKDDWADEKKVSGLLGGGLLKKKAEKIAEQYPRQSKAIKESLQELSDCEKENSQEIDRSAGCFGRLMADLFVYKEDMQADCSHLHPDDTFLSAPGMLFLSHHLMHSEALPAHHKDSCSFFLFPSSNFFF